MFHALNVLVGGSLAEFIQKVPLFFRDFYLSAVLLNKLTNNNSCISWDRYLYIRRQKNYENTGFARHSKNRCLASFTCYMKPYDVTPKDPTSLCLANKQFAVLITSEKRIILDVAERLTTQSRNLFHKWCNNFQKCTSNDQHPLERRQRAARTKDTFWAHKKQSE